MIEEFYSRVFGDNAKITAEAFPLWIKRAEAELSGITLGKSENSDDYKVKLCLCEMAECLFENSMRCGIESENNDGYSIKYSKRDIKNLLNDIAKRYLSGTGLLYRGDLY